MNTSFTFLWKPAGITLWAIRSQCDHSDMLGSDRLDLGALEQYHELLSLGQN